MKLYIDNEKNVSCPYYKMGLITAFLIFFLSESNSRIQTVTDTEQSTATDNASGSCSQPSISKNDKGNGGVPRETETNTKRIKCMEVHTRQVHISFMGNKCPKHSRCHIRLEHFTRLSIFPSRQKNSSPSWMSTVMTFTKIWITVLDVSKNIDIQAMLFFQFLCCFILGQGDSR